MMASVMSRRLTSIPLVAGALLALAGALHAQAPGTQSVVERLRQVEQERRTDLAATESYLKQTGTGRRLEGAGGWFTFTALDFSDDDRDSRIPDVLEFLDIRDLRFWYQTQVGRKFSAYLRGRFQDFNFDVRQGSPSPDLRVLQRGDLDLGYIDYRPDPTQRFRTGRQFLALGRGFALAEILDALSYTRARQGLQLTAFYGTTPNRLLNVDTSIVGFNQGKTHRDFAALEAAYTHRSGNRYYAYHMGEVDGSESLSATQSAIDFHYNANYTGIGSAYRLTPRVTLLSEGILQGGSTLTDTQRRVNIDASMLDLYALWSLKGPNDPLVNVEYAFGSGDDRRLGVVESFGGKQDATTDRNFLYFGRIETGVALSPRLSNLHMGRIGYQQRFRLYGRHTRPLDPLVGVKYTEYFKEHIRGAISDPLATGNGRHVGSGFDTYVAWRALSDVALNLQYGHFKPGNAYPTTRRSGSDRYVLSTTLSF